ncbi:nonstructural protein [Capybara microvirus Cap1_SP_192]|nr:nonstructural protein [Capybara microvirus Cap1_SP_192]
MLYQLYSVHDDVANLYFPPVCERNEVSAKRNFEVSMLTSNPQIPNFNKDDYSLYFVGSFDDEFGDVVSTPKPNLVLRGLDCVLRQHSYFEGGSDDLPD